MCSGRRRSWPGGCGGISRRSSTCRCWLDRPTAGWACVVCSATHTGLPADSAPRLLADSRSSGQREGDGCVRPPEDGPSPGHRHQVGQVDDGIFFHGYHSSIWSNGLAGGWLSACGSAMSASGGGVVLKRTAVALRCWRRSASRRALRVAFCAVDTISRIWPIMRNSADSSTCSRPCCRNFASACRVPRG